MTGAAWIAALLALFAWWFSTGAILVVTRLAERAGGSARLTYTLAALPLLGLGFAGFWLTLNASAVSGVFIAFLSAIAVWGWIELAFLMGVISGPNLHECPQRLPAWERFIRAWGTIAYHEMLLVAVLLLLLILAREAPNPVGAWTFATLYAARVSAKLNLFFGVPRINVEFVPKVLGHLTSHFRIARLNWFFPISVTALTFACAVWTVLAAAAPVGAEETAHALLAALTALALLEHWLMVLPLPDAKLWRWMLPAPKQQTKDTTAPEVPHAL